MGAVHTSCSPHVVRHAARLYRHDGEQGDKSRGGEAIPAIDKVPECGLIGRGGEWHLRRCAA
jgi:hypothetical protein